jgi:hypothetical protein
VVTKQEAEKSLKTLGGILKFNMDGGLLYLMSLKTI